MTNQTSFISREKRFEITDQASFDSIVSRAGCEDSLFYAELIDFSRTGMKLNVPFFARFDEILKVRFDFKGHDDLEYAGKLRVRHIRTIDENTWQVGCSLDHALPEDIIAHFAEQNNQERRRYPRVEAIGEGLLRRQGTVTSCDARIINISDGGFCLEIPNAHEVGERVDLAFPESGEDGQVSGRIRWQREFDGAYRIGCSFVDTESYQILRKSIQIKENVKPKKESEANSPYLITAAMFAMLLPSFTYFLLHGWGTQPEPRRFSPPSNVVRVESSIVHSGNHNPGHQVTSDSNDSNLAASQPQTVVPSPTQGPRRHSNVDDLSRMPGNSQGFKPPLPIATTTIATTTIATTSGQTDIEKDDELGNHKSGNHKSGNQILPIDGGTRMTPVGSDPSSRRIVASQKTFSSPIPDVPTQPSYENSIPVELTRRKKPDQKNIRPAQSRGHANSSRRRENRKERNHTKPTELLPVDTASLR